MVSIILKEKVLFPVFCLKNVFKFNCAYFKYQTGVKTLKYYSKTLKPEVF